MKLLAKVALVFAIGGAGAGVMYAAPGGDVDPAAAAMIGRANGVIAGIRDDFRHVEILKAKARRDRDLIRLNCINDKLVQMKPEMNIADSLASTVREGGAMGITELEDTASNIKRLREAADGCVGEKLLTSESANDFSAPPIVDSPTGDPFGTGEIEPPAYASPFN